jgi:pyrroline-5-carboxylate reductase
MMEKIGFIGCGNMARGMIRGILASGLAGAGDVTASARTEKTRELIRSELNIRYAENEDVASSSDLLILAVKPQVLEEVIFQIRDHVRDSAVIVSIAAGKSLAWLQEQFGGERKIVRAMPNTPALVQEGMSAVCPNALVSDAQLERVLALFRSFGRALRVPETLLDAVTAVSGSSPAYVFLFIEAMADGAVALGMPRDQAYFFAAQTVLGSAKMVLETGLHPGQLKDMVCSPGGTTIEAVRILEKCGLRSSVMEAELACARKAGGM